MMKRCNPILVLVGLILTAFFATCLHAQMVSPLIDRPDQPFSYFSRPTDEIGMMDAEAATEITPEGYLRTGYGEMMFFAGPALEPTKVRIRTLEEGRLPIVHYEFERDGVAYRFTLFAATLNGMPEGKLVNFIRITMKNQSSQPNRAIVATGIRYDAPNSTGDRNGAPFKVYSPVTIANSASPSAASGSTPSTATASFAMAACSTPSPPAFLPVVSRFTMLITSTTRRT
jgi:hypothetical protein